MQMSTSSKPTSIANQNGISSTALDPSKKKSSIFYQWVSTYPTVTASSTAAAISFFAGFPFDSIKTRMQAYKYSSLSACVASTYHTEGVHGFFRGVLPPLLSISMLRSISFTTYNFTKKHYLQNFPQSGIFTCAFSSGAATGAVISLVAAPFEYVKIQRQLEMLAWKRYYTSQPGNCFPQIRTTTSDTLRIPKTTLTDFNSRSSSISGQPMVASALPSSSPESRQRTTISSFHTSSNFPKSSAPNSSTISLIKSIVRQSGPLGLYRGFPLHSFRDIIGTGTYFGIYEWCKATISSHVSSSPSTSGPTPLIIFISGGLCGVVSWLFIFPIDLLKTNIQKRVSFLEQPDHSKLSAGVMEHAKKIWNRGGVRAYYRGIEATLVRAFPIHALNFAIYEAVLKYCTPTKL